jgi:hypothetical protein
MESRTYAGLDFAGCRALAKEPNRCGPHNQEEYDNLQDRSPKLHSRVHKTAPFDKPGGRSRNRKHRVLFMERQAFHVRSVSMRAGEANPVPLPCVRISWSTWSDAICPCVPRLYGTLDRVPRSELLSEMIFRESRSRLCESRTNCAGPLKIIQQNTLLVGWHPSC